MGSMFKKLYAIVEDTLKDQYFFSSTYCSFQSDFDLVLWGWKLMRQMQNLIGLIAGGMGIQEQVGI